MRSPIEAEDAGSKTQQPNINRVYEILKKKFGGLAAIQKPVSDENNVIYLSRGLGKKYSVLVTAVLTKPLSYIYTVCDCSADL